jgi:hypothetical protein
MGRGMRLSFDYEGAWARIQASGEPLPSPRRSLVKLAIAEAVGKVRSGATVHGACDAVIAFYPAMDEYGQVPMRPDTALSPTSFPEAVRAELARRYGGDV